MLKYNSKANEDVGAALKVMLRRLLEADDKVFMYKAKHLVCIIEEYYYQYNNPS